MSLSLNELNRRLAAVGLPFHLTADSAAQLKDAAPRERVLRALARVEDHGDNGARIYLERTLAEAGLSGQVNDPPAAQSTLAEPPSGSERKSRPAPPASNHGPARPSRERLTRRPSHHVYGGRAALTFELDETTAGAPTVALDAAIAVDERKYNWSAKARIQFTARELPVVAAVLLGISTECSFSNHGPANDKGFSIAWQAERQSFFVKVWQGKRNLRAVPMPREDAFYAAQLVIRAIQQGSPARLDAAGVIATLRAFYGRG